MGIIPSSTSTRAAATTTTAVARDRVAAHSTITSARIDVAASVGALCDPHVSGLLLFGAAALGAADLAVDHGREPDEPDDARDDRVGDEDVGLGVAVRARDVQP